MIDDMLNKVVCGDCLEVMKQLPDESVDCVITDPPYGYSFMGKDWDKAVPSVAVWRECLRVLKAGSFAFVMSAPRQDVLSQMIVRLGEAGFNTGFTSLYWAYSSGFPKAGNIGKMVDKRQGITQKIIGIKKKTQSYGFKNNNCYGGDIDRNNEMKITKPHSPEALILDGSFAGFQPKPAVEVVIVVMKPLSEKTYVEQALKNWKGITWLDKGRIPYKNDEDKNNSVPGSFNYSESTINEGYGTVGYCSGKTLSTLKDTWTQPDGRFPANLLVEDNVLDDGNITKGSKAVIKGGFGAGVNTFGAEVITSERGFDDSGGFSRYFSLDAWWNKRVEKLPREVLEGFPFLVVPKASKSEKNGGLEKYEEKPIDFDSQTRTNKETADKFGGERKSKAQNHHPTVKPLKLFSYLTTIGSREHDIVLDPFCGSGTIGIAARVLNRKFVGIELMKEYADIANARIAPALAQKKLYEVTEL